VDWLLDTRRDDAIRAAVRAVDDYLRRHGSDESTVPEAVVVVTESLRGAAARGGLLLHLDWTRVRPRLTTYPAYDAPLPPEGVGPVDPGLARAMIATSTGQEARQLEVSRDLPAEFDPDSVSMTELDPFADGAAAVAVALAAAAEAHPVASPDQVAAAAGAMLADAALRSAEVSSGEQAAALFVRLHDALGGAARSVDVGEHCFEVAIDRSPFGPALGQIPSLARLSEAIAGRVAAPVLGRAVVVHDESIALGDPADRLTVFLGDVDEDYAGSVYTWPPTGTLEHADASPRLEMAVCLPRQSHSVPVIRRLAAQILRAFGVSADPIHDVELAISEACANVIQHAVDSEGYEVSIELAADRCAITVLDRGEGFDHTGVSAQEDDDAESGRGLSLMDALVDNLNFVSEPKVGAVVHMVKRLDWDESHPFRRTGPV
jgi:serine/threonine-protein kinase RsbW